RSSRPSHQHEDRRGDRVLERADRTSARGRGARARLPADRASARAVRHTAEDRQISKTAAPRSRVFGLTRLNLTLGPARANVKELFTEKRGWRDVEVRCFGWLYRGTRRCGASRTGRGGENRSWHAPGRHTRGLH